MSSLIILGHLAGEDTILHTYDKTYGNSRPFAEWIVIIVTLSASLS